jgi:hypothetical protein
LSEQVFAKKKEEEEDDKKQQQHHIPFRYSFPAIQIDQQLHNLILFFEKNTIC